MFYHLYHLEQLMAEWICPAADLGAGLYQAAKFYYGPVGTNLNVIRFVNRFKILGKIR